jgi:hypothetical protein
VATPQRLKFSNFAFDRFPNSRCRATVVLERGEFERFEEAIEAVGAEASELRCAAQATVNALNRAVGDRCYFELLGVKAIKAFDTTVVIVAVSSRKDAETRRLVGSYLAEDDPVRGAAVAVLNATNRFLGNEIFAR